MWRYPQQQSRHGRSGLSRALSHGGVRGRGLLDSASLSKLVSKSLWHSSHLVSKWVNRKYLKVSLPIKLSGLKKKQNLFSLNHKALGHFQNVGGSDHKQLY